ncbi:nuclease-related domain-containing protein [Streptomyces libani]|uniref:nuclease-related domain-containing protein n=1 Tax=Streptomyces TaxID=1883 RepID=UPI00140EA28E|nr:nuclease-related domain-containing protein [Streptomyces sp. ID38640]QIK08020.1 NERD domain-containing protein [Streptomyces sp. ID38640]
MIERRDRRSPRGNYDRRLPVQFSRTPEVPPASMHGPAALEVPPPQFDLLNNEPGEALTRRAIMETGSPLGDTSWHKGAAGEVFTSNCLEPLRSEGWFVADSVPLAKGGDIDHLAIGPSGVFVINSKNYTGAQINAEACSIFINAKRRDDLLEEARIDAEFAAEVILSQTGTFIQVTPVLAFVNTATFHGGKRIGGVLIAESKRLAQILKDSRKGGLTSDDVTSLMHAVRDSRVWSS